jgi:hypothetical protein
VEIHPAALRVEHGAAAIRSRIVAGAGERTLWFELDERYAKHLAGERLDAFLVAALLRAMGDGEDVVVHGPVSARLLYNLRNHFMPIMARMRPRRLRPVRIHAEPVPAGQASGRAAGVGTGFSAGVDSLCAVLDHHVNEVEAGFRLTHLFFANTGSHGHVDHDRARLLFRARLERVRSAARELGLELVRVDSNLSELVRMPFLESHVPRNLAPVLLLQGLIGRYLYASTHHYGETYIDEIEAISHADPVSVPLLSSEELDFVAIGAQHTRIEKTARIARMPGAERWLNVCTDADGDGSNCSVCAKCCRTLFALELLGELERFGDAFDLARWRGVRARFVRRSVLADRDAPFMVEIREHCARAGRRFPLRDRAAARWHALRGALFRS